jgi:hypothetical protein
MAQTLWPLKLDGGGAAEHATDVKSTSMDILQMPEAVGIVRLTLSEISGTL